MKNYYAEQLEYLRELGVEYARRHPAIAPMLASQSTDPDVERLLEGTAFLCGLINERLDKNFPELVEGVLGMLAPETLLPQPSRTIVVFSPLAQVHGVQRIEAGTVLESVPVSGQTCPFSVPRAMPILPVSSSTTRLEVKDGKATLVVTFQFLTPVQTVIGDAGAHLVVHLAGELGMAQEWFYTILCRTRSVQAESGGICATIPVQSITPVFPAAPAAAYKPHLGRGASLLDCELLHTYFTQPEEFLFLDIAGLERLAASIEDILVLRFDLNAPPKSLREPPKNLVVLNATPAANVFPLQASPFQISGEAQDYRLSPQHTSQNETEVFDILRVVGMRRGGGSRTYLPYDTSAALSSKVGRYYVRRNISHTSPLTEYRLGLLHNTIDEFWENETIACKLLCYQPRLPHQLHIGDICVPSDDVPAMCAFTNITPPTSPSGPISDSASLWMLYSCMHTNMMPLTNASALRDFLTLCLPKDDPDPTHSNINRQRIAGVTSFTTSRDQRIYRGRPLVGTHIQVTLEGEGFQTTGDRFLFGNILNEVLSRLASINSYTRLTVSGAHEEPLRWPPRLGTKHIL